MGFENIRKGELNSIVFEPGWKGFEDGPRSVHEPGLMGLEDRPR